MLGDFDPTKGSHLVLWECKLVIEFPPGSTILIPSAIITHSNVPIQAGEKRYSVTQYATGVLFRWVVIDSVIYAQKLAVFLITKLHHAIAVSRKVKDRNWVAVTSGLDGVKGYNQSWLADLAKSQAMTTTRLAGYLLKQEEDDNPGPYTSHILTYFGVPVHILYAMIDHDEGRNPYVQIAIDKKYHKLYYLPFTSDERREMILGMWNPNPTPDVPYVPLPFNPSEDILCLPLITHSSKRPSSPMLLVSEDFVQSPYTPTPFYPPHPNDDLESPQSPLIIMDDPFIDPDEQNLPQPFPDSGQSPGQWWYTHVREIRMAQEFERDFGNDSDEEGEEVVESEKSAIALNKIDSLPLAFVSNVFVWEPTPNHALFLLHRRLETQEGCVMWPLFPLSHHLSNTCTDEWDLYDCSCDCSQMQAKTLPCPTYSWRNPSSPSLPGRIARIPGEVLVKSRSSW